MNKKYVMLLLACLFLLISGICYSCTMKDTDSQKIISASSTNLDNIEKSKDTQVSNTSGQDNTDFDKMKANVTKAPEEQLALQDNSSVYVHICGAVKNPGVYETEAGARVSDLIKMSGGLCKDAAGDYVNQARKVTDGERIYIPVKDEVKELTASEYAEGGQNAVKQTEETSKFININTATAEELMKLPGIGQAKADSIIEYRSTNGDFQSIEELMNISGIKEGLYNRISSFITVK